MRKLITCIFVLLVWKAMGQTIVVSGRVTDSKNKVITSAQVQILNNHVTLDADSSGRFATHLFKGVHELLVTAPGYAGKLIELNVTKPGQEVVIILSEVFHSLDEVVVTSEKREQLLKDLPIAVTALPAARVEQLQLWNAKELTAIVPTMYAANPGDNRNVISIRGVTSNSYDPAVATYIDGVNQFSLDTYIAELLDIERIEVLRGPQGTLYGRNAMGGVINIITKGPSKKAGAFASATIGNYGLQRFVTSANVPLSNKLFFRVSGVYNHLGGFYTNLYNNSKYDKQHSSTAEVDLKYLVSNAWSVHLNAKQQFNRNNAAFPLIFGADKAILNPFVVNVDAIGMMYDDVMNTSLGVNYSGRQFNFTSLSAYQSDYRFYERNIDADFSPLDGISIHNNYGRDWNNVKALTQEFRFASAAGASAIKWLAGTYFFYQHNPVRQATVFGEHAKMLGIPDSMFSVISTSVGNNFGQAVFGQVSIKTSKKLELIAGLRYDAEQKKQSALGEYQKNFTAVTRPDTTASVSFNELSPKLGLIYKFSNSSSAYFNYSQGFRAGGLTQMSSDPSMPPLRDYNPEHSSNLEIGSKHQLFNNRISLSLAAFLINIRDVQVPTLILPDAITVTSNAGRLRSSGVEAELSAVLLKGLTLNSSFGYTKAEYKSSIAFVSGKAQDIGGNRQVFTPSSTAMLGLVMNRKIGKHIAIEASAEWYYIGKQYFDLANNLAQGAYHLANGRIGFSYKAFKFLLSGKNLTDGRYLDYGYGFGAVHLGNPRVMHATFSVRF
jgi:iron complex outermembrane receptor protein